MCFRHVRAMNNWGPEWRHGEVAVWTEVPR